MTRPPSDATARIRAEAGHPILGLPSEADDQAFVWENVVDLRGGTNPDFFAGAVVEDAARRHLRRRAEAQNAEG